MKIPKNLSYAFGYWLIKGGYQLSECKLDTKRKQLKTPKHFIARKNGKTVKINGKTLEMNEHAKARYKVFLKCWLDSQCDYPKKLVQEFKC